MATTTKGRTKDEAMAPDTVASAESVAAGVGPSNEHEAALDFANYFVSYGYIYHQKDMLQVWPPPRTGAARPADAA